MRRIQAFNKMPVATIKAKRNKVLRVLNDQEPFFYITKIICFANIDEFMWFEREMGERLQVLKRINNTGIMDIVTRGMAEVEIKQTQKQTVAFLTKREVIGPTLARILERQKLAIDILMQQNIKQVIWSILALIVGGGGYGNLIITLDNLIFEEVGDNYRPALNYFSFCGLRLLKFKKAIEKEEFIEIAMFLDDEAFQSGSLDRFQFKARNFALIVISLLLRRNPSNYIFYNVELQNTIDLQTAKRYCKKLVKQRIDEMMRFKSLAGAFKYLNIAGLEQFIKSALNFDSQQENKKSDWQVIHKILLQNKGEKQSDSFNKIPRLLWQSEEQWVKKMLTTKGLGIGENGQNIYMAFKISAHLQCLLQYNDWKTMMRKLEYSYKTHQMFHRLLKCTTLKDSKILQQTTRELVEISQESFKVFGKVNDQDVTTQSHQLAIINDYLRYSS